LRSSIFWVRLANGVGAAIFLGAASDDANLLMIRPKNWRAPGS